MSHASNRSSARCCASSTVQETEPRSATCHVRLKPAELVMCMADRSAGSSSNFARARIADCPSHLRTCSLLPAPTTM